MRARSSARWTGRDRRAQAWPKSGPWEVVLTRANEGDLLCVMLTGHRNADAGELYLWGFRSRAGRRP